MAVLFRPAQRSEAKPLVGLYSESGCGKTRSSLLLARGFVGPDGTIGMIETEAGRGEAYVGDPLIGQYLVRPIRGSFSPVEYGAAIAEAESAKVGALIIDSASHEWEGAGGVLAMAAEREAKGSKGVLIWQQPKIDHQRHFMLKLMQTSIPLVIVCMRAKYPMVQKGTQWARSEQLEPKQSEDILFEMFIHGWIDREHKFHGTKYTLDELRRVMPDGQMISVETGIALAKWARGGSVTLETPKDGEGAHETYSEDPTAKAIHDDIIKFLGATSDPEKIREAWSTDVNVPTLKSADAVLYERAYNAMRQRLKELRA